MTQTTPLYLSEDRTRVRVRVGIDGYEMPFHSPEKSHMTLTEISFPPFAFSNNDKLCELMPAKLSEKPIKCSISLEEMLQLLTYTLNTGDLTALFSALAIKKEDMEEDMEEETEGGIEEKTNNGNVNFKLFVVPDFLLSWNRWILYHHPCLKFVYCTDYCNAAEDLCYVTINEPEKRIREREGNPILIGVPDAFDFADNTCVKNICWSAPLPKIISEMHSCPVILQ